MFAFVLGMLMIGAMVAPQIIWAVFSFRAVSTRRMKALWVLNVVSVGIEILFLLWVASIMAAFSSLSGASLGMT